MKNETEDSNSSYSKAERLLEQLEGDKALFDELASKFVLKISNFSKNIEDLLEEEDLEKVSFEAHALKCEAQNFIEGALIKAIYEMESNSREGNLKNTKKAFCLFKSRLEIADSLVKELVRGLKP